MQTLLNHGITLATNHPVLTLGATALATTGTFLAGEKYVTAVLKNQDGRIAMGTLATLVITGAIWWAAGDTIVDTLTSTTIQLTCPSKLFSAPADLLRNMLNNQMPEILSQGIPELVGETAQNLAICCAKGISSCCELKQQISQFFINGKHSFGVLSNVSMANTTESIANFMASAVGTLRNICECCSERVAGCCDLQNRIVPCFQSFNTLTNITEVKNNMICFLQNV